jgi:MazG family protein
LEVVSAAFDRLRDIVARLRAPDGCPWDREQTHTSLREGLLEETYEVLDAIDRADDAGLREELGDLVLQSVMHAQIAAEENRFTIEDVLNEIADKLVRRHPHVFGGSSARNTSEVLKQWDQIKREEKGGTASVLDGVPENLPALMYAQKLQKKAARAGFDWPDASGVLDKIREELQEIETELAEGRDAEAAAEIGDLLFTVVNLARKHHCDAELLLRQASHICRTRFQGMEAAAGQAFTEPRSVEEWEVLWEKQKAAEGRPAPLQDP